MNEKILDLSPFCMRARGFVSQGRIDDALGIYSDVLQVDPSNALAHADRGTAYAMLKKFDLALEDLEKAIALGYEDSSVFCTVATIYFEKKQHRKALDYFAKAAELDPNYPLIYYNRSNVMHELGDSNAAIADLEKCLSFDPEDDLKELIARRLDLLRAQR